MNKKFSNFSFIDNIKRFRGIFPTRLNKYRLDANERVSDFDVKFIERLKKKIKSHHFTTYPEVEEIYDLIAKFNKVKKENIMITSGSDIGIRHCFELFAKPNSKVLTLFPTFGMYDVYSKIFRVKQIKIRYDKNLQLDFHKLLNSIDKKTNLIMIANPNSPTGTIISEKNIFKILNKAKSNNCFVVIDEAYFGFYKNSSIKFIKKFTNLVVLRTFSKAIGMAGIRAGYIISNKKNIERLYTFRPMYEISSISCLAIKEVIKNYGLVKKYITQTEIGKKYLIRELRKLNLKSFETYSNFILVDFRNFTLASKVFYQLHKKNILSRRAPNIQACANSLRFTLGPKKYMQTLIKEIKKII
tara:strand:- start:1165 stop:2235 length:1071 start_codon:yes stop_codon:yes gene_type:complete